MEQGNLSFLEHLDILRGTIWKIALASVACAVAAFLFKDELFGIILAPRDAGFVTYDLLSQLGDVIPGNGGMEDFAVSLVNTDLAGQFSIHIKVALYDNERRYTYRVVAGGYLMFILGLLLNYFLIFPFTFRFLGTYQVSSEVANMITLESYMDTLLMMSLMLGILFELPMICWLLGKLGILTASFMRRYRRHAIVAILAVAAVITPTSDIFTLLLVSLPIWLLYEASIFFVPKAKP